MHVPGVSGIFEFSPLTVDQERANILVGVGKVNPNKINSPPVESRNKIFLRYFLYTLLICIFAGLIFFFGIWLGRGENPFASKKSSESQAPPTSTAIYNVELGSSGYLINSSPAPPLEVSAGISLIFVAGSSPTSPHPRNL